MRYATWGGTSQCVHPAAYLALTVTRSAASSWSGQDGSTLRTKNALPSISYTTDADSMSDRVCVGWTGAPARASATCKSLSALCQ